MTIFVVDDDVETLEAMVGQLRAAGMRAYKFRHRTSALNASCHGIRPDIIIAAWHMDGIPLHSFAAQLRCIQPEITIVLSSATKALDVYQARQAGIAYCLHKHLTAAEFSEVLFRIRAHGPVLKNASVVKASSGYPSPAVCCAPTQ
jgi:DNA-binding response OmpR family regulator